MPPGKKSWDLTCEPRGSCKCAILMAQMTKGPFRLGDEDLPAARVTKSTAEIEVEGLGTLTIDHVATIGRAPESHVVLNVRSVSRHHARIFFEGGHYWIKDLDSGNGTTVNGKKIKLQMLSDGDKIGFGEAKAVFRTSARSAGPAPLAHDPLEGSDPMFSDGTPTGGLRGPYPPPGHEEQRMRDFEATVEKLRKEAAGREAEISGLYQKIQTLQAENEALRRGVAQPRGSSHGTVGSGSSLSMMRGESGDSETERLRRLVSQLERTLADSNIKIRNLQERVDRGRH